MKKYKSRSLGTLNTKDSFYDEDPLLIIRLYSTHSPESNNFIISASNRKLLVSPNTTKLVAIPYDRDLNEREKAELQYQISLLDYDSKILIMGQEPFYQHLGIKKLFLYLKKSNLTAVKKIELWGCNTALTSQEFNIKYDVHFRSSLVYQFAWLYAREIRRGVDIGNTIITGYLAGIHTGRNGDDYVGGFPKLKVANMRHLRIEWEIRNGIYKPIPLPSFEELGYLWGSSASRGRLRDLLDEDYVENYNQDNKNPLNEHSLFTKEWLL